MRAAGNDDAGDPDVQVVEMVNLGFSLIYNENFKARPTRTAWTQRGHPPSSGGRG